MSRDSFTIEYTEYEDARGIIHRQQVDALADSSPGSIRSKELTPFQPAAVAAKTRSGKPLLQAIAERIDKEAPSAPESLPVREMWETACPLNRCDGSGFIPETKDRRAGVRLCGCHPPVKRQTYREHRSDHDRKTERAIFGDEWDERA